MRKEKNNLEKPHFLKKNIDVSVLTDLNVLECTWSCMLIETECVRCTVEGHPNKCTKPARHMRSINL